MEKAYFSEKPEKILYMKKPSGLADAWLRANICEEMVSQDGQEYKIWTADETFLPDTILTAEQIEADFFNLFVDAPGIQEALTKAVQEHMDTTVQTRGYDNINSACSYATSTDAVFLAEAQACVVWRDKVWRYCYDALADVTAGARDIPTAEQLIAELPVLEW
ncbi:MAG: hypothetical protein ACI3WU_01495 [Phascolarctobacterium sp.]